MSAFQGCRHLSTPSRNRIMSQGCRAASSAPRSPCCVLSQYLRLRRLLCDTTVNRVPLCMFVGLFRLVQPQSMRCSNRNMFVKHLHACDRCLHDSETVPSSCKASLKDRTWPWPEDQISSTVPEKRGSTAAGWATSFGFRAAPP